MANTVRYPVKQASVVAFVWMLWIVGLSFGAVQSVVGAGWAVALSIILYFVLGVLYVRADSLLVKWRVDNVVDYREEMDFFFMMFWRVFLWPWAMVFDLFATGSGVFSSGTPFARWFLAPVFSHEAKIQSLEEQISLLLKTIETSRSSPEEVAILQEVLKQLRRDLNGLRS